jgi:hypothetical protein
MPGRQVSSMSDDCPKPAHPRRRQCGRVRGRGRPPPGAAVGQHTVHHEERRAGARTGAGDPSPAAVLGVLRAVRMIPAGPAGIDASRARRPARERRHRLRLVRYRSSDAIGACARNGGLIGCLLRGRPECVIGDFLSGHVTTHCSVLRAEGCRDWRAPSAGVGSEIEPFMPARKSAAEKAAPAKQTAAKKARAREEIHDVHLVGRIRCQLPGTSNESRPSSPARLRRAGVSLLGEDVDPDKAVV